MKPRIGAVAATEAGDSSACFPLKGPWLSTGELCKDPTAGRKQLWSQPTHGPIAGFLAPGAMRAALHLDLGAEATAGGAGAGTPKGKASKQITLGAAQGEEQ